MSQQEYFSEESLAPYLRTSVASSGSSDGSIPLAPSTAPLPTNKDEADAAAGLHRQQPQPRVSSFGNLFQSRNVLEQRSASVSRSNAAEGSAQQPRAVADSERHSLPPVVVPDWRLKERMRTVACGLVLALNIDTPPPDTVRPNLCAVLTSWIDPTDRTKLNRTQAAELIAERLEQQYSQWQRNLKFRHVIDPTVEQMRSICERLRRDAKNDRLLLHFNGHGVPRPTDVGELWVVDKNKTEYIPIAMEDIKQWLGSPSMIILDCSNAATLIPYFCNMTLPPGSSVDEITSQWVKDVIILCPCGENEVLPMHPDYPADLFTSCLTTPIPMALRWFILQNPALGLKPNMVDLIPGNVSERKTPLGELNWILTSVLDAIAWNILPKPLFQRLFRQDLMVASMFRNFLLADRILRGFRCTPQTVPPMPADASLHPLWLEWDLTCETFLFQLKQAGVFDSLSEPIAPDNALSVANEQQQHQQPVVTVSLPFFTEQLIAFEHWLNYSSIYKFTQNTETLQSPEQLPVIFQILLGPKHRVWALKLFKRFFEMGPWAVNLCLTLGIFPYVNRLLVSPEYRSLLVPIWASILSFDPSCRSDLLNTKGSIAAFCEPLMFGGGSAMTGELQASESAVERTTAAFVLAVTCYGYPNGQSECFRGTLHLTCCALLSSYEQGENHQQDLDLLEAHLPAYFRLWLCICLANMVKGNTPIQSEAYAAGVCQRLQGRLRDRDPRVRAAAAFALGCLIGSSPKRGPPSSQDLSSSSIRLPQASFLSPVGGMIPSTPMKFGDPRDTGGQVGNSPQLQLGGILQPNIMQSIERGQHQPNSLWGQQASLVSQGYVVQPNPSGFMVGSGPMVTPSVQGVQQLPSFMLLGRHQGQLHPLADTRRRASVFDDRQRFERDMVAMEVADEGLMDASANVRYEAAVALGIAVQKYMDAFLQIASETLEPHTAQQIPHYLNTSDQELFRRVWGHLRSLQREDPFPLVKRAITDIVSVVHDQTLRFTDSDIGTTNAQSPAVLNGRVNVGDVSSSGPQKGSDMRRVVSEVVGNVRSMEESAAFASRSLLIDDSTFDRSIYKVPESRFYDWQRQQFTKFLSSTEAPNLDHLSPEGAADSYQERRNFLARAHGRDMARYFERLVPLQKAAIPLPGWTSVSKSERDEEADRAKAEEDAALRKDLSFSVKSLLRNGGVQMTCRVDFHAFEDVLVSCSNPGTISIWETSNGRRLHSFENGNPKDSRITCSFWLNEESKSLYLTGCNDGSVRLWSNFVDELGEEPFRSPVLTSAFRAMPTVASRLVVEWQQHNGLLIAGGNSTHLHCWDAETQTELRQIRTYSDNACVTCLTTAWDKEFDELSGRKGVSTGAGPHVVVAGQSDGCLKIFDIRSKTKVAEVVDPKMPISLSEHVGWVVNACFVHQGGQNMLVSGTIAGEIKTWDLRMRKCVRTVDIQRSLMTAMAMHKRIPIIATGAEQFLKLATLDGETIQAIRYFGNPRRMVGPVTCLAFHPYKPLLAYGATDEHIGIYGTNKIDLSQ